MLHAQGLRRDDIVVLHLPNSVEQYLAYMACARLGLIVTPVPVQYREHELSHVLSITKAAAVLTFTHIGKSGQGHHAAAMYQQLSQAHPSLR